MSPWVHDDVAENDEAGAPGPKRSREPTFRLSGRQPTLRAFHRTGRFHRESDDDGGFRSVVRSHTATDDGFRGCRRRHLARRIPITTRHSIGGSIKKLLAEVMVWWQQIGGGGKAAARPPAAGPRSYKFSCT